MTADAATLSPDARIAQVQAQAAEQQSGVNDPAVSEQIATTSHYGSMAAGAALAAQGGPVGLAAFGAGIAGGMAGAWVSEQLGAPELVAKGLQAFGMRPVGAGGPHPGTVGKPVAHSLAFAGFLASIVVGAVAAVAVGALIVATGGMAAVAIIGAAAAGGFAGGLAGSAVAGALASMGTTTGAIATGSPDVFIEGQAAARVTDTAPCSKENGAPSPIVEGSETIFVNGLPLARVGHKLLCGAVVDGGAASVLIDTTTTAIATPAPDIPLWARVAADWVGILPLGKVAGAIGKRTTSGAARGKAACNTTCAADPVDVATGAFVDWRTDLVVPGVLPVELLRRYDGQASTEAGFFGPRWRDSWHVYLRRDSAQSPTIDHHDEEGVVLTFETPHEVLQATHLRTPYRVLRGTRNAPVLCDSDTGLQQHFEWIDERHARLAAYADAHGNRCDLVYHPGAGRLQGLRHSDGWQLLLHWGQAPLHATPHETQSTTGQADTLASIWLHEPDRPAVALVRYTHDAQGRLTHCASLASGRLRYRYDDQHRIVAWGDASLTRVSLQYDEAGRATEVRTSGGEVHSARLAYHPERRLTEVWAIGSDAQGAPRLRRRQAFLYNDDGLVTHERDALGRVRTTEWDRHHRVTAQVDALGRRTTHHYSDSGRLTTTRYPDGRSARFVHDEHTRLTAVTDVAGRRRTFEYGPTGLLTAHTQGGLRWHHSHDARGRLHATQGPEGSTKRQHWDEHHRPCGQTAANGGRTAWRQDRLGRLDWVTDASGATTTYGYADTDDPLHGPRAGSHTQPERITRADGSTEHFQHDAEGQLRRHTDAAGHTQHWQWGAFDLLAEHTDALGKSTTYHWGSEGRLAELENAAGQRWRWRYDAAGQCVEQVDFAGRSTHWRYDSAGRSQQRRAPDGATLHYTWDSADRLSAVHAHAPDGSDQLHLSYHHDPQDQLVCARVWHLGPQASRLHSELRMAYDGAGRLREELHTDETGRTRRISWRHDAAGRIIGRDAALGDTRYALDALGLLAQWHSPHGALHLQRDPLGRELERQGFAPTAGTGHPGSPPTATPGFVLQHRHDPLGRLVLQQQLPGALTSAAGQTPCVRRQYHWQADRLVGVDDAHFGRVRWQLDTRDQILQTHFEPLLPGAADFPAALREHPASAAASAPGAVRRSPLHQQFDYDALGNLAHQDGAALRYAGDTVVEHGALRYHWDACGRLVSRTEARAGWRPRTWHYQWDALDRLVAVHSPDGQRWRYLYDAFGRRRAKRCDSTPAAPAHDGLPLPSAKPSATTPATTPVETTANTATTLLRGLAGQATPRRTPQRVDYLWDGATVAAQWKVYADGRSAQPGSATHAADHDEDVQEWHFEPGSFRPLALVTRRTGEAPRLLHLVADLNGAPREALDHHGQLVWAGQLDTWGHLQRARVLDRAGDWPHGPAFNPVPDRPRDGLRNGMHGAMRDGTSPSDPPGTSPSRGAAPPSRWRQAANDADLDIDLRQANQWADEESGLLYNLHRHYDPDLGQYTSQDPLGPITGGLRTHGYVHNPATWVDPLGLAGCPTINMKHIFHGEINANGRPVGFHHEGSIGHYGKARLTEVTSPPNANGIYRAKVEIFDKSTGQWTPKNAESTFFPKSWSRSEVTSEIRSAYANGTTLPNGKWSGISSNGVKIEGWTTGVGRINTAYPIY